MNWGNRLLLVFVVFAFGISYLVYRCVNTPVDLVTNDYYKEELAYQQVIDATRNANALTGNVSLKEENGMLTLRLPQEMQHHVATGSILFYCASDQAKDKQLALALSPEASQTILSDLLAPGHYIVKIRWTCAGKNYFSEQKFDRQ